MIHTIDPKIKETIEMRIDPVTGEIIEGEALQKELEALEANKREKQKNMILYVKNIADEEKIIDMEIERLKSLKSIAANKKDALTNQIMQMMNQDDELAVDFTICGAKIYKNPPAVFIEKDADVSAYTKTEIVEKVDKTAIREDLKSGKKIKGCKLIQGERLQIV